MTNIESPSREATWESNYFPGVYVMLGCGFFSWALPTLLAVPLLEQASEIAVTGEAVVAWLLCGLVGLGTAVALKRLIPALPILMLAALVLAYGIGFAGIMDSLIRTIGWWCPEANCNDNAAFVVSGNIFFLIGPPIVVSLMSPFRAPLSSRSDFLDGVFGAIYLIIVHIGYLLIALISLVLAINGIMWLVSIAIEVNEVPASIVFALGFGEYGAFSGVTLFLALRGQEQRKQIPI